MRAGVLGFLFVLAGILLLGLPVAARALPTLPTFGGGHLVAALLRVLGGIVALPVARGWWELEPWTLALALLLFGLLFHTNLLGGRLYSLSGIVEALEIVYLIAVSGHFR